MAEVFAGHVLGDHGFQKPVAIKRLLPELASDHVFVDRLIEEAKLLVGMQHGNIVSVLDLARDGDDVFLVMEFVDGPSLRQLLKARGSRGIPLGVASYIVQSAAAGLAFAHGRPGGAIIHADISPSNLLLTTSGEVRVADFGIARREGGGHGVVEGKWAYMAPEQARGEPLTPRSDVFALGVVLYELICGEHPFGRQVTHEARDSEPLRVVPPRAVRASIPAGLDAICMRALAHDARDRYKSMQQLIDAIVEERFSNHWREAAADLAAAIREAAPGPFAQSPRTQVTDRPVTIMTRSLLRDVTPARRASGLPARVLATPVGHPARAPIEDTGPSVVVAEDLDERGDLEPTRDAAAQLPESGAQTKLLLLEEEAARAAAMLEIPSRFRAEGGPLPAFRFTGELGPGSQELASVVGGHTITSHQAIDPTSSSRWAIAVFVIAALLGIIAALVFHLQPEPAAAGAARDRAAGATASGAALPAPTEGAPPPGPARAGSPLAADDPGPPSPTVAAEPAAAEPAAAEPAAGAEAPQAAPEGTPPEPRGDAAGPAPEPGAPSPEPRDPPHARADEPRPDPAPAPGAADPDAGAAAPAAAPRRAPEASAIPEPRRAARAPRAASSAQAADDGRAAAERASAPRPPGARPGKRDVGYLRVHTTPWAKAMVGTEHQYTPAAKFRLAPGRYAVRLSFPTLGVTETHQVTIEATKTFTLNINKEDEN
jgi:tRNA A-37 threonylcarbamoyl transferase component Bud32